MNPPGKHTLASKSRERSNEDLMIEEHEQRMKQIQESDVSDWVAEHYPTNRTMNHQSLVDRSEDAIDPDLNF